MALSVAELKRFIQDDIASEKKRRAKKGQDYYEGKHDILNCRLFYYNADGKLVEDTTRSNIKIVHPFFMILVDQLSAYALSKKENPIQAKKKDDGLQDILDEVFDDDFWSEIGDAISGSYTKGFEYVYRYKNSENKSVYQCADSMGVVEVQAKDADDGQDHVIYWYIDRIEKGRKTVKRIQDWTKTETWYYVQIGDGAIKPDETAPYNPRPHVVFTDPATGQKMGKPFGHIPFWRLDYNKKQTSGLMPIKGLIDDYDLHACSLSNNLTDFDTPLYVVSGFQGDNLDELQQNLKTKKIVGVDSEGGVTVQTVDIPYQARKEKLEIDERNIYIFGMGFNPAQVGDGNITNIVILSRYTLLDLKKSKLDKRLKKMLKQFVKIELDEINKEHGTDYQMSDITIDLTPEIPTNEAENLANEKLKAETQQIKINTILNAAANIGDEQVLKSLCDILELDYKDLKDQVEKMRDEGQSTANAMAKLEGVVTDEQAAETGSGAIPE
jgi:SPP1 family phage portal protein